MFKGFGRMAQGSGFRVQSLGCIVQGMRFKGQRFRARLGKWRQRDHPEQCGLSRRVLPSFLNVTDETASRVFVFFLRIPK